MQELTAVVARHSDELRRLREDNRAYARRDAALQDSFGAVDHALRDESARTRARPGLAGDQGLGGGGRAPRAGDRVLASAAVVAARLRWAALAQILALKLGNAEFGARRWAALLTGAFRRVDGAETRADLDAVVNRDPACADALHCLLHFKGFLGLQLHRCARALWLAGDRRSALLCQSRGSEVFGMDVHPAARVGAGCLIDHATGLVIGETAVVGRDCSLLHGVTLGGTGKQRGDRHPKLGDRCLVGAHASVLGNVRVGARSKIGCGSVVLADIPAGATAVGVPAKVVGRSDDGADLSDTALRNLTEAAPDFRSIWRDRLLQLDSEGLITPNKFHDRLPHLSRAEADALFFSIDHDVRGVVTEEAFARHFHKFAPPPGEPPSSPVSGKEAKTVASVFDAPSAPDWCALNASTWHPGVAVNPLEGDGLVLSGGDDSPQPRPTPRRDSRRSLADLFESPPGGDG
ncbi:serine O-acetyltransferase [Aureococcus anophagefferens]|nr:serine O-acetyltransferase [Aureococcus anophagefferens]